GPEILNGSLEILSQLSSDFNFNYEIETHDFGGIAIDNHGTPLPDTTLNACKQADAILLGAVGGPKWTDPNNRPEQGLLGIRKSLGLFANIRPTTVTSGTSHLSPIKKERVAGTDFILVRELTGGIYFGEPKHWNEKQALDSLTYTREEIERIARVAFDLAQKRHKKLTSVDKENVLSSSKLWRKVINDVANEYPDVEVNHLLVDACAMHLITNPSQFDVIVTENLFGDILSDEASVIPGSYSPVCLFLKSRLTASEFFAITVFEFACSQSRPKFPVNVVRFIYINPFLFRCSITKNVLSTGNRKSFAICFTISTVLFECFLYSFQ